MHQYVLCLLNVCLNKFKFTLHSKRLKLGNLEIPCMRNCLEAESNFICRNEAEKRQMEQENSLQMCPGLECGGRRPLVLTPSGKQDQEQSRQGQSKCGSKGGADTQISVSWNPGVCSNSAIIQCCSSQLSFQRLNFLVYEMVMIFPVFFVSLCQVKMIW